MSRPPHSEKAELKASLFENSKKLGIIPPDFPPEKFEKNFFYLCMERFNCEDATRFDEDLFKEKNYILAMLRAFDFSFARLVENKAVRIDIEFLDQLYERASTALDASKCGYREEGSVAGFDPESGTRAYVRKLKEENYETKLFLLPEIVVGKSFKKPDYTDAGRGYRDLSIVELYICNHIAVEEIRNITSKLIDIYYAKIDEINSKKLSEEESEKQKLELISAFIGDFCRFHGRKDGNGRLGWFLLLNHLLIQENLTPSMVFYPWLVVYALPQEAAISVAEGQRAFEEFFIKGQKMEPYPRAAHLGLNLEKLTIFWDFDANKITHGIFDLFFSYLEIREFENREDLPAMMKTRFLKNRKLALVAQVDDLTQIEKLQDFSFPIPTEILLFVTMMRAAFSFNESGLQEKTLFDRADLKYSFQNFAAYFRDVEGIEISYEHNHDNLNLLEKLFRKSPTYAESQEACDAFLMAAQDFLEIFSQIDEKATLSFSEISQIINGRIRPLFERDDEEAAAAVEPVPELRPKHVESAKTQGQRVATV